jgi:hypothetical protein
MSIGEISETLLDVLRLKIGFRIIQPEEAPASSAELPEGALLLLVGPGTRLRGTLVAQGSATMLVKLDEGVSTLARDTRPTLYFHNSAGIFSFPTRITDLMTDAVRLEQPAEKILPAKEFLPSSGPGRDIHDGKCHHRDDDGLFFPSSSPQGLEKGHGQKRQIRVSLRDGT